MLRKKLSRRRVVTGAGGISAAAILHWPANAAEFNYKLGGSSPMEHPAMARSKEAAEQIKRDSNGRIEITIYPNNALGGDTAMIAQVIAAAMEMYSLPIDLLAPRNPGVGFYGACAIGRVSPDDALWRIWPYLGALAVALAIIVAFPWLSIVFRNEMLRTARLG